jgi:hypothetical protein
MKARPLEIMKFDYSLAVAPYEQQLVRSIRYLAGVTLAKRRRR